MMYCDECGEDEDNCICRPVRGRFECPNCGAKFTAVYHVDDFYVDCPCCGCEVEV